MNIIIWFFSLIYEIIADLVISIVGHHRNEQSFNRREKVYKPIRDFISKYLHIKIRVRTYKEQLSKTDRSLTYKVVTLTLLILGVLWLRYSVIEPYKIPSGSMIPTLKIGDHIFVNKLSYGLRIPFLGEVARWGDPKRGEVVTFYPPMDEGKMYVKRLVGVPGDRLRIEDDKLYINDELINKSEKEFYPTMNDVGTIIEGIETNPDNFTLYTEDLLGLKHNVVQLKDRENAYRKFSIEIVVPENSYFFMGDDRDNSADSRMWGFASREAIRGKAMFIWLSLNWSKSFTPNWIRFSRFGKVVR